MIYMAMEQHVPTFDACKRLREAGFPQETFFSWVTVAAKPELLSRDSIIHRDYLNAYPASFYAAPILTEILEQLPKSEIRNGELYSLDITWDGLGAHVGFYVEDYMGKVHGFEGVDHNPAAAAAQLWLELNTK